MFTVCPATVACVFNWAGGSYLFNTVLWAQKTGFTFSDQSLLADDLVGKWNAATLRGSICNELSLTNVQVIDMTAQGAPAAVSTVVGLAGSSTDDLLPWGTSMVRTFRTAKRGRSYRGRMYMMGFPETAITNGEWQAEPITRLGAFVDDIRAAMVGRGFVHVLVSRYQDHQQLETAEVNPITSHLSRSTISGTQRRRNRRP